MMLWKNETKELFLFFLIVSTIEMYCNTRLGMVVLLLLEHMELSRCPSPKTNKKTNRPYAGWKRLIIRGESFFQDITYSSSVYFWLQNL